LPDESEAWFMGSENYVKEAIKNVESWMKKRAPKGSKWVGLKTKVSGCFPSGWSPETDVSPLLKDEDASWFQQQVGVLRWMIELGRIEISAEVSMLAAFSCAPRQGHLDAVLHLFAWLKMHKRSKLVFDPSPMERPAAPEAHGWETFYSSAKEKIPLDMPEPRGKEVQITAWVDSDHAGNVVTRRSRTGVLIFCNRSPIVFHSKKQGSIETSSFGSEFIAMKTGIELIAGLRFKLRMMGVPLDGAACVIADNMSVVHNCTRPESVLKKKSCSVAFHFCRESIAAKVVYVVWTKSEDNLADMFTKSQPGSVRIRQAQQVLF
jgi:hypothetical protein